MTHCYFCGSRVACRRFTDGFPRQTHAAAEDHMTLHIAAVGDWTRSLYQLVKQGRDEQVRRAVLWYGMP